MNAPVSVYAELEKRFREVALLRSAIGTLEWDRAAWLPAGASAARGEQLALLERLAAERLGSAEIGTLLRQASGERLSPARQANLREMRRDHLHAVAVPSALLAEWASATTACEREWRAAREQRDFAAVTPSLERVVTLTRTLAEAKAQALGLQPYEALLDRWEPGLRQEMLSSLLDGWRSTLPPLAAEATRPPPALPAVPVERQRACIPALLHEVGFDANHGVIAESAQPCFSDDTPDDVRITLRYETARPLAALRGGLHETGHSFYERQVPGAWRYQPLGRPRSGGLQESQALLWEVHVGGSAAFRSWLAPRLQAGFGWSLDGPALAAGWVGNDLARDRHDSGELGYLLHLLVRCELEPALLDGSLPVRDLPGAWTNACRRWLGRAPAPEAAGCLADIHWYRGLFGYFPSYLLGAALAAQFMAAARRALPALDDELAAGRFGPLRDWLGQQVWSRGSALAPAEIVQLTCGEPPSGAALVRHLRERHATLHP